MLLTNRRNAIRSNVNTAKRAFKVVLMIAINSSAYHGYISQVQHRMSSCVWSAFPCDTIYILCPWNVLWTCSVVTHDFNCYSMLVSSTSHSEASLISETLFVAQTKDEYPPSGQKRVNIIGKSQKPT